MRAPTLILSLLLSVSLAACASDWKPPEVAYDDQPVAAVLLYA